MANSIPKAMHAIHLTGHGGPEKLHYRTDIPVPMPKADEVLIRVAAAAINNTDINTRVGWYSKSSPTTSTSASTSTSAPDDTAAGNDDATHDEDATHNDDATWSGTPLHFPRIQGADCTGRIVSVGPAVDTARIGQRILVRSMLRGPVNHRPYQCWTFGSECDGGFAQYAVAPSVDVWEVKGEGWSDVQLACVPCAFSTAENMVLRAEVGSGDRVVVTGASGGVGVAAVQLVKIRGAEVIAIAGAEKAEEVKRMGADRVVGRGDDLAKALGKNSVSVVLDLVGGEKWPQLLEILKPGGRYAVAGAIAGPHVSLDLRKLYLKDLKLIGCTWQEDVVFDNIVRYIEEDRVRPFVSKTYALQDIAKAQEDFMTKRYAGKLVLVPP